MSETNNIIVKGFAFENEAEGKQARKEAAGAKYIAEKVDMDSPERVLQVYNKMIQEQLFETVVGFSYMKELQEYLRTIPFIDKEAIRPIPVRHPTLEASILGDEDTGKRGAEESGVRHADYMVRYKIMRMLCIVLAICVAAMFAITATTNSPTILNYERQIVDRYEAWEQELTEREAALMEAEQNGSD